MDRIAVLVVDDSAVMRSLVSRIVQAQPDMTLAGVASDPILALERLRTSAPDVITLDVEMPRMNGLEFLRQLMQSRPLPVVMVSSLTERGADTTLRALELGAVDFIAKPQLARPGELEAYANDLAQKLREAARARVRPRRSEPVVPLARCALSGPAADKLIVIGASTGGVEALREVLVPLPADMPPIVVAQHMPPGFTRSFAQRLDALCQIGVKEAENGEALRPGQAYIAPGGTHLLVERRGGKLAARISLEAPVNRHRPSVDTLFRSAADAAGERCIGLMLSGMGADGALAMLEMRRRGAHNIAQDEASCVVFGMPKRAIAEQAVHDVLPLGAIAARLVELCLASG